MSGIPLQRVAVYDGIPTHGHGFPVDINDNDNFLLVNSGLQTVFSFTAPEYGDYLILLYVRVVTANTNTTIVLNWSDESGPESTTLTSGGFATGAHTFSTYIHAVTGSPVYLTADPATGNRLYCSWDCYLL